jgi:hypothetical protein
MTVNCCKSYLVRSASPEQEKNNPLKRNSDAPMRFYFIENGTISPILEKGSGGRFWV